MLKKLFKSGIAFVLAFSMVLLPCSFAEAKQNVDYTGAINQAAMKAKLLTSYYGITSVQYALIDDGEIVLSGQSGVYSKEATTALTSENMYGIGSVSKMVTTVAVMQLVDKGKVKLDTPIVKYIPEFKMADSRYKDITVRMLLNHSSGLMGSTYGNMSLFDDNDTLGYDNLLGFLKTQSLKADPGAFSVYCNDGFSLAQLLVEKVSGISFSEYIEKNISKPLGLNHTKTPADDFSRNQLAKTYLTNFDTALPTESINAVGAGGVYSTAEDMCHFAEIFMGDSEAKVLSNDSATAMSNAEYKNGLWASEDVTTLSYGLGWDSVTTYPFTEYGIKALEKGGDTGFYHGSLIVLPEEGLAMAVLSSGGSSVYNQIFAEGVLLNALLAKGSIKEIKANKTFSEPVAVLMPEEYLDYGGYYAGRSGVCVISISKDGVLSLKNDETASALNVQRFIYTGDGRFYDKTGSTYLTFQKQSNGTIYLYSEGFQLLPSLGEYVSSGYLAQKITPNKLTKEVKAVWEKREKKKYLIISEKYSSQTYAFALPVSTVPMLKGIEGYAFNTTIADANTAKMLLQIPGVNGRDLYDLTFFTKNKAEYMKANEMLYISTDAIASLSSKASFKVELGAEGYAKWYKFDKKAKNKKLQVTLPKNASYSVYNSEGNCIYNSVISSESTVTLPAGGYIVFVGSASAKFAVNYVK